MLSNDVRSGAIKLTDPQNLPQYYHNKRQLFAYQFFIVVFWNYGNFCRFGVRPKLGDYVFPNSIQLEFTQRPLLSGPPQIFAPDHPPLVPKWFMFLCFGSVLSKALPWKSQTTVSPRLCCALATLLASSLPPGGRCFSCCFGRRCFDRRPSHDCQMTSRHH